jgi:sulfatase maturation enzyme AslB (radical SAM superfamily)
MLIYELLSGLGLDDDQADLYRSLVLIRREPRERVPDLARLPVERAEAALTRLLELGLLGEGGADEAGRPCLEFGGLEPLKAMIRGAARPVAAGLAEWVLGRLERYRALVGVPSATVIMPADRPESWHRRDGLLRVVHDMLPALDLRIGTICNFNCVYCLVGHEKKSVRRLGELLGELKLGRLRNLEHVNLTGGEPTLHPDLLRLIKAAVRLGYRDVTLVTNGAALSRPGVVERVLAAGVTRVGFSLDTVEECVHDALVRRPGMLPVVQEGIRRTLAAQWAGPRRVVAINVVTRLNLEGLNDTVHWMAEALRPAVKNALYSLDFVVAEENAWTHREVVVPRMSQAAPRMAEALRLGAEGGLVTTYRNVPGCVMPGHEALDLLDDHIHIGRLYGRGQAAEYEEEAINFYRVKRPSCRACRLFKTCWGVHMSYVHQFGFEEFKPIG